MRNGRVNVQSQYHRMPLCPDRAGASGRVSQIIKLQPGPAVQKLCFSSLVQCSAQLHLAAAFYHRWDASCSTATLAAGHFDARLGLPCSFFYAVTVLWHAFYLTICENQVSLPCALLSPGENEFGTFPLSW